MKFTNAETESLKRVGDLIALIEAKASRTQEASQRGVETRVLDVFRDVLELDADVSTSILRYSETETWDCLAHITLISGLEREFDIMFDPDDILAMSTYDKAVEITRKYYTLPEPKD